MPTPALLFRPEWGDGLCNRTRHAVRNEARDSLADPKEEIELVEWIARQPRDWWCFVPNVGKKVIGELDAYVSRHGLTWATDYVGPVVERVRVTGWGREVILGFNRDNVVIEVEDNNTELPADRLRRWAFRRGQRAAWIGFIVDQNDWTAELIWSAEGAEA